MTEAGAGGGREPLSEEAKKKMIEEIMEELELRGGSKRRLLEKLAEKYGYDKKKVLYKAKRAFITYRYEKVKEKEEKEKAA
ncbi:MAG: hypothetical protein OD814_001010 [Candidatus Alkanophagales archaeon MCA70_species_1]|nr:hypothetical protein [Candidatus Alkanophaga volatiphilum]